MLSVIDDKHLGKPERILRHLIYGYFVAVNQIVITTVTLV